MTGNKEQGVKIEKMLPAPTGKAEFSNLPPLSIHRTL